MIGLALHNYEELIGTFPPGYVSSINLMVVNPCNLDLETQNGVDLGTGWAWGSMILSFLEQQPLYSSINFNLSVAYAANDTCSLTALSVYLCPSDDGPSVVPVFDDPPDPANPNYSGSTIVDTLSRGNYVGMWGLGEICAQSGATDAMNNNGLGSLGQHAGIFYRNSAPKIAAITDGTSNTIMVGERSHNLSYVTWVARSIKGWLGKTSLVEGGTDHSTPRPRSAGPRSWARADWRMACARSTTPRPTSRTTGAVTLAGRTCSSPTARSISSSRPSARFPGGRWPHARPERSSRPMLTDQRVLDRSTRPGQFACRAVKVHFPCA